MAIRKKTVDYFPHWTRIGVTRRVLEDRYGNNGYAFWFKLLETLCTNPNQVFDFSNDINRMDFLTFVHMEEGKALEILNLLAELKCIDKTLWETKRFVWSQNLVDYLSPLYKKRTISEKPARPHSGAGMPELSADNDHSGAGMHLSDGIPVPESAIPVPECPKVEKRREEREILPYPSLEQVQAYCKEHKLSFPPERFHRYYQALGWEKSGQPIKDWQALAEYWETLEKGVAPKPGLMRGLVYDLNPAAAVARGDVFHNRAIVDGICRYCGQRPGFYPRLDNTPSVVSKACHCAGYQEGLKQAVSTLETAAK